MKLYVLFLMRKDEDELEAMAVADEYTMEVNPDYLCEQEEKVKSKSGYLHHEVVEVTVPVYPIYKAFEKNMVKVDGSVNL